MPEDEWFSPIEPPTADPLVWKLATQVWKDHMPDRDGWCPQCKVYAPCDPRETAGIALARGCAVMWQNYS